MHHETETVQTPDGARLLRHWAPDGGARLVLALVHGVHEHSGRYAWLAGQLLLAGVEVWAVDLRGHGQSDGPRGDVERFDDYLDDLDLVLGRAREAAAGRPLVVMGHSMGGLVVARALTLGRLGAVDGVVLSSPALAVAAPALLQKVAPFVARWAPRLPAGRLDVSALSRDPTVGRAYQEDPLNTVRPVAARLGWEILQAVRAVRARPEAFDLPLYVFHGTEDTIVPVEATRWLADAAPSSHLTVQEHPGLRHETFREPEREAVVEGLVGWLGRRADAAGPGTRPA